MPARGRRRARGVELERYRGFIGEWDAFVAASTRPEPTVFRVRTGRVSDEEVVARLERQGFRVAPVPGMPAFHRVVEEPYPVSATLEHWAGLLYVQQASTGVAAPHLGVAPGERVLDLCAAPGGKTTHIAELMGGRGCLIASEIDERRIRGLLGNVYRLGHAGVVAVACDGRRFPTDALFDRVLVDAPCSGEGTLRKRSGDVHGPSESFLSYVTGAQRALLQRAVRLCRPGGTVLYVTCTFSPDENEAVVSDVLAAGGVELEPVRPAVPHAPGLTSFGGRTFDERLVGAARIYPHHLDSGGLFMARLRRLGEVARGAADRGWTPVPASFPTDPAGDEGARASADTDATIEAIADRYGIPAGELRRLGWIWRGGRAWAHTVDEWPLESWSEGSWRPVSVGMRALEFDSRGRPRPTNDFLRLMGGHVGRARVELSQDRLRALLAGNGAAAGAPPGPVALAFAGDVVGRGMMTRRGLVSEIPKARAADLERVLAARAGGSGTSGE